MYKTLVTCSIVCVERGNSMGLQARIVAQSLPQNTFHDLGGLGKLNWWGNSSFTSWGGSLK